MANIVESKKFVWSEAEVNHNKWWQIILYDNGDVQTNWARVGYDAQSKVFSNAGRDFMEKKIREKLAKGYTEARVIDGSTPESASKIVAKNDLREIARSQLLKSASKHPVLDTLIDRLVKSNVHKITSSTNITFNATDTGGVFQTPLGVVTAEAITEARTLLADTIPFVKNGKYTKELERIVSSYLRLIPQNIGMRFNVQAILPDVTAIQKQGDVLDALEASYQAVTSGKAASKDAPKSDDKPLEQVFQVDLDVETGNDAARLEQWFEKSKKSQHGYDRIKVRNVFKVKIHQMANAFVADNPKEVFHGTSEANCLSILKSGLRTSPPSTAAIAGKMWGNGVYGAINSSKSLGYTYGNWGQGSGESGWLFICLFALGKPYYPTGYGNCSRPPSGHDSVWATAAKTGLYHDELIVYANNRVTITHLLECK
jgi:predicted DNA-binding WGR domain protein